MARGQGRFGLCIWFLPSPPPPQNPCPESHRNRSHERLQGRPRPLRPRHRRPNAAAFPHSLAAAVVDFHPVDTRREMESITAENHPPQAGAEAMEGSVSGVRRPGIKAEAAASEIFGVQHPGTGSLAIVDAIQGSVFRLCHPGIGLIPERILGGCPHSTTSTTSRRLVVAAAVGSVSARNLACACLLNHANMPLEVSDEGEGGEEEAEVVNIVPEKRMFISSWLLIIVGYWALHLAIFFGVWNIFQESAVGPIGKELLENEQDVLLFDLKDIPKKVCDRRINEFVKRARAAKIHAYIIGHLKNQMPTMMGKAKAQQKLIDNLEDEFAKVQREHHLPAGDFPYVDHFRDVLGGYSIEKFEKVKPKMIQAVDNMLGYDIPELLKNFRNPYE